MGTFSNKVIEDTALLPTLESKFLEEFCKISFENIHKGGVNKKIYSKAASQIGTNVEKVMNGINSLTEVFLEASRTNVSSANFKLALQDLKFSEEQMNVVTKYYHANVKSLRSYISNTTMKVSQYQNFDWRLDVQTATRCARHHIKPSFLLELKTKDANGNPHVEMLESDFANMKHMSQELEMALKETRAKHATRIFRYVKG